MTDDPTPDTARRSPRPCPICKAMSVAKYHPFCSRRCADIDLHRWFTGRYAVPAEEPPDDLDEVGGGGTRPDDED